MQNCRAEQTVDFVKHVELLAGRNHITMITQAHPTSLTHAK